MSTGLAVDPAAAQHDRAGERCETRGHVHDGSACEIKHAPLAQQPVGMPRHVRERRVDEQGEQHQEQDVSGEAHPLREPAGDERRRDDRELELEHREQRQRNGGRELGCVEPPTPSNMKYDSGLPMTPPMLSPNDRLNPTTTHTTLTTPIAMKLCSIVDTRFLRWTMPP